jgi:hypothetical protein
LSVLIEQNQHRMFLEGRFEDMHFQLDRRFLLDIP